MTTLEYRNRHANYINSVTPPPVKTMTVDEAKNLCYQWYGKYPELGKEVDIPQDDKEILIVLVHEADGFRVRYFSRIPNNG